MGVGLFSVFGLKWTSLLVIELGASHNPPLLWLAPIEKASQCYPPSTLRSLTFLGFGSLLGEQTYSSK